MAFAGPGFLVAVGYMDPGNWATDLAGGSNFGYPLLCVILLSNLMAILLAEPLRQARNRLRDATWPRPAATTSAGRFFHPVDLCEMAIAACDLAEVIGSAIALNLLFHIPLVWGVCITALDVLLMLFLQHKGFRMVKPSSSLIAMIGGCFGVEIFSQAEPAGLAQGFFLRADHPQSRHALYRHRHSRRDGDAAQPLPALLDRADPQISSALRKESARPSASPPSIPPLP